MGQCRFKKIASNDGIFPRLQEKYAQDLVGGSEAQKFRSSSSATVQTYGHTLKAGSLFRQLVSSGPSPSKNSAVP